MLQYEMTVKNYRCFSDASPARFVISNGMIAFLGANNAGKSALLKMFQEFRNVWATASQGNFQQSFIANPCHVHDSEEIFYDGNERDISVEIKMLGGVETPVQGVFHARKVILTCSRATASSGNFRWVTKLYLTDDAPDASNDPRVRGISGPIFELNDSSQISIANFLDLFKILAGSLYIGPFRNAITVGAGTHYDVAVGESFITAWNDWQNGVSKRSNVAISRVVENIRKIMGFRQLSIMASMQTKTLQLSINDRPYKLSEVGSGLAQLVMVFGSALIKRPSIIFIDEPEMNLHPRLQLDFLLNLAAYASEAVVFATHSIGLARSAAERIYTVTRSGDGSTVAAYEKSAHPLEMLGELSFSSSREFGAESLLLVEGTSDVKVMQQFLRKVGKDHKVVVLPLGGNSLARGGVQHELAELLRVTDKVAAVVDSERETADAPPSRERQDFFEMATGLGFKVHLTERRATENYFTGEAIKLALGDGFEGLAPYERLNEAKNGWAKSENWRIAKEMPLEALENTDIGGFLKDL